MTYVTLRIWRTLGDDLRAEFVFNTSDQTGRTALIREIERAAEAGYCFEGRATEQGELE